jgi:hypothetical protein
MFGTVPTGFGPGGTGKGVGVGRGGPDGRGVAVDVEVGALVGTAVFATTVGGRYATVGTAAVLAGALPLPPQPLKINTPTSTQQLNKTTSSERAFMPH